MNNIQFSLHILETTRSHFISKLKPLTNNDLNYIPSGFNNNLAWNFGHVIATQQLLIYGLSNTEMYMSNEMITNYRKGSKPTGTIKEEGIQHLFELSEKTTKRLKIDYDKGNFSQFKEYTTGYGVTLKSIEEAIIFNNAHEALHLGTCIDILKLL